MPERLVRSVPVSGWALLLTAVTTGLVGASGLATLLRFKAIPKAMARVGVPRSWLVFPIGTLKTLGALGLLAGMIGWRGVGVAASGGLVVFFACAVHTHLLAGDRRSVQFGFALSFLALCAVTLAVNVW